MRGYAICTEPRSGSTWLCRVLESTGVLGVPTEYFNANTMRRGRGFTDYPLDPEDQIPALLKLGATPNGVYGLKIFAHIFDHVAATRWAERLPNLKFISLVRLDALGQAISHVRAMQTQQWVAHRQPQAEPVYDFDHINNELVRLLRARTRWAYYLSRNDIPVLHLEYERIVRQPQETAEAVARFIGLEERPVVDLSKVSVEVQRDALSDDWRARYVAQARDLGRFD
ncbi:MAG TPA: Stf0 family sulfotransferase [Caulobacteraceae bacterium]|nr:Stf0 family sulfotransferase [Caulobacteraceae bacterium]